jgi:hypothetical protein
MSDAFKALQDAIAGHVPPEAASYNPDNETTLRQKVRYRIRIRGTDMNYEVVARFTGFGVPETDATEVLILEFVPEHSFADPDDQDKPGPDA